MGTVCKTTYITCIVCSIAIDIARSLQFFFLHAIMSLLITIITFHLGESNVSGIDEMVQSVLAASEENSSTRNTSVNFDLYIQTKDEVGLFFQFVPPQFNPKAYLRAIQNILHLLFVT